MSVVRPSRVPGLLAVPALAAIAVAGCSSGGSASHTSHAAAPAPAATGSQAGQGSAYTASQLRAALLTKIGGQHSAQPAESGSYGSLAEVKATKKYAQGADYSPPACAKGTVTGFNSAAFARVPASTATFRLGQDGVSEMLLAPTPATTATVLKDAVPAGCTRYTVSAGGKKYAYTLEHAPMTGVGQAAEAMHVQALGTSKVNVWSVMYRAGKFVGAITIVGPDASRGTARTLAIQEYSHAAKVLQ